MTAIAAAALLVLLAAPASAQTGPCAAPITNPIACENTKPGNPASEWDVSGSGSASIQGYATAIGVDQGQPITFKVNSSSSDYRLDIYRLGYYGGQGARRITTVQPSAALPQSQPACNETAATGLIDCGNWAVSASWTVPADAVSGIYLAKLVREDGTTGTSHIAFVVRDDDGNSDLLFQTSDTTWQAYNEYGGNSLYTGDPDGRAYKVSYNRPFTTRGTGPEDWIFNAEYPMVRWLERNGYNVSYTTGVDVDRAGAELLEHDAFLSVGHDEYWSGTQRANVEAARAAGVNLAFFSGNEVFWKTRWEDNRRTLVTYKETHADGKIDPLPLTWTGTWRDPRFSPPADGGKPENALTGQLFMVNDGATGAIEVPAADGKMRFWRNTSVATLAAGQTATLPQGTLGYEWDEDPDNGFRPAGSIRLSSTTDDSAPVLVDQGSEFESGTARHNMTLYRAPSGARVFGAGTVQWAWGLDATHDRGSAAADVRMQQATLNLLADMRAQPATLQAGLVAATASTDATAPTSTITSPAAGATVAPGAQVTISGTATDAGGGVVGGVEVSTDNGQTWRRAEGRGAWTYTWSATGSGSVTLRSRAADDSGNLEAPGPGRAVTVGTGGGGGDPQTCPCSIWDNNVVPARPAETTDNKAVELGLKFRSSVAGRVAGVRFYKGATNTGTHIGRLWTRTGQQLAQVTFTNETASGWQEARFSAPVDIQANTTYVVSYHAPAGNYASGLDFFRDAAVDRPPLRALRDGEDGGNGLYGYGPSGTFPTGLYRSENYWVDVVFETGAGAPDVTPPTVAAVTPARGATGVAESANVTVRFSEPVNPTTVNATTITLRNASGTAIPAAVTYDSGSNTATLDPTAALAASTLHTALVRGGAAGVQDFAGNPLAADDSWTFTTRAPSSSGCPCSLWQPTARPQKESENDRKAVEVGTRFRSDIDGVITGIRYYKGALNTGTHTGHLWSATGQLLATATFTNETATGWQQVTFANPVAISANTNYVASYHAPVGGYAVTDRQFFTAAVDAPPLHALRDGDGGANGLYSYGPSGTFPTGTYRSEGYWVDVVFDTSAAPDLTRPTVTAVLPAGDATGVPRATNVSATFSEAMEASTISGTTFRLRDPGGAVIPAAVSYDAATRVATLDPSADLAALTRYTATVSGGTGGAADRAGNTLQADRVWSFTTAAPPPVDETGPTVAAVTPARGAAGVTETTNVTVRFSEPVNPATVTATTITLRNAAGTAIPAAVTYDAASTTATLDPTAAALAASTVHTALVRGGAPGVKDVAGNAMAIDDSWTFTTRAASPSGCPCSLWQPSARPQKESENDRKAVEVGTRFRSDVDGLITGIRFYKGALNTGTHTGHLWTGSGQLLATATFTNETATGWQEVTFANPVAISANTNYVASYHAPVGGYAMTDRLFFTAGVDRAPLHAPRDGDGGSNGIYAYGPSGTFPTGTYRSEGYWVDVVFDTASGPDVTRPTVTGVLPAEDAAGVPPATSVNATFSEPMEASTISGTTFRLRDAGGAVVQAAVSYDAASRTATLDPSGDLADSTRYTATVSGGTGGAADRSGNTLAADRTWSFTTAAPPGPGPDDGPGGPVLVISKTTNPFSRYYAEILRAEGVNAFAVRDIANVTATTLASYDVAIVGDYTLTAAQVSMLSTWVNGGGDLIAMRPDKQFAGLLGLTDTGTTLANAYMRVDATRSPGAGIVSQTMQFHGTADRYNLNGATSVAALYTTAAAATTAPAVTTRNVGASGGTASAFTYDLARSVVQTRQGNPAWAGQERDGELPIRSDDLFFGAASFDPQPNWVDLSKVAIPQADEQQRLLVNLIGQVTADKKPMPRFWYFPRGVKAAVVMTGDDHAGGGTAGRFNQHIAAGPAGCSVAQWECIRATSYVYPSSPLTDAQAASFIAQGFEVGAHVTTNCDDASRAELEGLFTEQLMEFDAEYPSAPAPRTNRNHCIAFPDWNSVPEVELANGIRFDTNYYYWPPDWVQDVPGMFTGSGMPMRFAQTDGRMIDVYQATTQMTDESEQTYPFTPNTLLDRALGATGYYGAFTANMHTDNAQHDDADAIVASARARGVPIVSAQQMLTWIDGRNGSAFEAISYSGGVLSFRVAVGAGATGLRAMLPTSSGGQALQSIRLGATTVPFTREVIKGVEYAFFAVGAGTYTATYAAG